MRTSLNCGRANLVPNVGSLKLAPIVIWKIVLLEEKGLGSERVHEGRGVRGEIVVQLIGMAVVAVNG